MEAEEVEEGKFEDGTRMAELAEAGEIVVGVRYDQPGLGFKDPAEDIPEGFDVEIAKLLVADLGIDPESDSVTWEETISDNREPYLMEGRVDLVLASYSITDERRALVGQTGPYFLTGQQVLVQSDSDVTGIEDLVGRGGVLGDRVDVAEERRGRRGDPGAGGDLLPVRGGRAQRDGAGDVDRRVDPARAGGPQPRGPEGGRGGVLRGADRRGLQPGPPGDV